MPGKGKSFRVAPSLLAADLSRLGEEIKALEKAGADLFHFDIMDGHFVPNLTFGFPLIESVRKHTKLPFDAHLMIENADCYIEDFAKAGCNMVSVHVEACPHLHRTVQEIKKNGMEAGVAINPGTSLSQLDSILPDIDFVLLMSVNPGFGGQKLISESFTRIKKLKEKMKKPVPIEVDGGIKVENASQFLEAGAEILVMGTGLLKSQDYGKTIRALRDLK